MHGGSRRGSHPQAKAGQARRRSGPVGSGLSPARASQAARPRLAAGERSRGLPSTAPLPDADRLTRLLEPVVHALDMDLEGIRVTAAGRRRILRVVVDADGGVSLDDIALASRELSLQARQRRRRWASSPTPWRCRRLASTGR